ncbi:hypothetical protein C8T65DRAFT_645731 [Cerioporus squamosus]|nr:hypothetical protein C8T65DRAFT_645731 [Cerioporus squamosus]
MSAALQLNEDILHEVMLYAGPQEQTAAARVARLWTPPAQKALYRTITLRVHSMHGTFESPGQRLVETLRRHTHLRDLVRQICIHSSISGAPLDWADMFPENSLRNFTYIVPHLTANGPMDVAGLQACFELPVMETLELDLSDWESRPNPIPQRLVLDVKLDASRAPSLKHLYIHVRRIREPVVNSILTAFARQLRSLHIHVSPGTELEFPTGSVGSWAEEFVRHVRRGENLTRVVFSGSPKPFALRAKSKMQRLQPFLNEVALGSAVEHLGCIEGLYTEELFRKLPHTVRVLEFYVDGNTFACEGALLDLLGRVGEDGLFLRRVTFFASEERRALFGAIERACRENAVEFVFFPVVPPLNNPPTRPPITWD